MLYANVMLNYFGKNKKIDTIKPSDVEAYRVYLLSTGKSKATVNRYISALKRAYNILINDDLIVYNPVNKVKTYYEDGKRDRYLTREEWERLKTNLSPFHLDIVMVALLTGFRKQNVLKLKWEQINLDSRIITLLNSENKGKKRLETYINDKLYEILLRQQPKTSGYVFINPKTKLPYTDIKKAFSTALKKSQITDFCFHDLRRTVGTWLLEEGVNIRVIQDLLGHSDISTTERYLSKSREHNIQAAQILNNYML